MTRPVRGTAAGRAYLDLQNRARREKRGTQELLTMYVVERWLARLSRSAYAGEFVLKGGMLLASFGQRRPTVDADALARNISSDHEFVARRVAEIAMMPEADDGVEFLPGTITTQTIRDDALYSGVRVVMDARLATAQIKFRLDINFGDPVTPEPRVVELPALRPGVDSVRVLGYPLETVLAEKLVTAIELGLANTRVRDLADVYTLTGAAPSGRRSPLPQRSVASSCGPSLLQPPTWGHCGHRRTWLTAEPSAKPALRSLNHSKTSSTRRRHSLTRSSTASMGARSGTQRVADGTRPTTKRRSDRCMCHPQRSGRAERRSAKRLPW